jgi:hypothetical protein
MAILPPSLGTHNFKVGLNSFFSVFSSFDFLGGGVSKTSRNSVFCPATKLASITSELSEHTAAEALGVLQVAI